MKRINNKGFTLVEMLAVIAIIAVLMGVSISAVTRHTSETRKKLYIDNALKYIAIAKGEIFDNKFDISQTDTTYYINIKNFNTEGDADKSPYAAYDEAYVVVVYNGENPENGNNYEYYWVSKDKAGWRIDLTKEESLDASDVYNNLDKKLKKTAIDDKSNIEIINENGETIKSS